MPDTKSPTLGPAERAYVDYALFRRRLESLELFRLEADRNLRRTEHEARCVVSRTRVADALVRVGALLHAYPHLMAIGLEIVHMINPHAALSHWQANLYYAASGELRRYGERSLADVLVVYEYVGSLCDDWTGPSLHASRLADELGVVLPDHAGNTGAR